MTKRIIKTLIPHDDNLDGSPRQEHCPGCWDIVIDDEAVPPIQGVCNECGENRAIISKATGQPVDSLIPPWGWEKSRD